MTEHLFDLVKCNNPHLQEAINYKSRYYRLSDLKVPIINGNRVCKWCGQVILLSKHQHYCSTLCRDSAYLSFNPQSDAGRGFLLHRQNYKCACCDILWLPWVEVIYNYCQKKNYKFDYFRIGRYSSASFTLLSQSMKSLGLPKMDIDHIVRVADGGSCFGFDNVQVLSYLCHKRKHMKGEIK